MSDAIHWNPTQTVRDALCNQINVLELNIKRVSGWTFSVLKFLPVPLGHSWRDRGYDRVLAEAKRQLLLKTLAALENTNNYDHVMHTITPAILGTRQDALGAEVDRLKSGLTTVMADLEKLRRKRMKALLPVLRHLWGPGSGSTETALQAVIEQLSSRLKTVKHEISLIQNGLPSTLPAIGHYAAQSLPFTPHAVMSDPSRTPRVLEAPGLTVPGVELPQPSAPPPSELPPTQRVTGIDSHFWKNDRAGKGRLLSRYRGMIDELNAVIVRISTVKAPRAIAVCSRLRIDLNIIFDEVLKPHINEFWRLKNKTEVVERAF